MVETIQQKDVLDLSSILKSDLFSNLLPEEKKTVAGRTGVMQLRKGGLLFSPGKIAEHLYMLLNGSIRVYKPIERGGGEEIARFAPGDLIGDFDFARCDEYDAQAEALEDSSLVMFPGFGLTMDSFALEAPHVVAKILLNSADMVIGRIKSTRKLVIESMSWVQELHRRVHEDPGTGLWKQSFLTDEINRLLEEPMALIMLKPDRFKVLVDTWGHDVGDKAMIKIASLLKGITRRLGRGWALRFRSNETGILVNRCDAVQAKALAQSLSEAVAALSPVTREQAPGQAQGQAEDTFLFSGSIAWGIWPVDDRDWNSLFKGTYDLLMDTWRAGGNSIAHFQKELPHD